MLDQWLLKDFDVGEGLAEGAHQGAGGGWIDVAGAGDTYLALVKAGRIPHPFYARHEADAAWVRDREWWWRTSFEAPPPTMGEGLQLVFEGLDTFATIYLDGEVLGQTDNMFRTYVFDIGEHLRITDTHQIAICFTPPAIATGAKDVPVWSAFTDRVTRSRRNLMRKAQFGWGWDWGPDLPTVGVWKPARLERLKSPAIASVNFCTLSIALDHADVQIAVQLDRAEGGSDLSLQAALIDHDGQTVASETLSAAIGATFNITVPEPRLWWTPDLGAACLYTLTIRLLDGDALLDQRDRRVGVRTLTLDTTADPHEPGTEFFRFILNGAPIFAKGVCWVPVSSFVGMVDEARYRDLLERAVGANMNMIRVWGGGIYEPDLFYDLCDELGLLVWQDFMFACAHYPEDDTAFVDTIQREVEDQVRRLRGHACLALWCGNNENQVMHNFNDQVLGQVTPLQGEVYYDRIIPEILAALDPLTPYRPSSPYGGPSPNSMRAGDVHNWTVWHGVPLVPDKDLVGAFDSSPEGLAYTRYAEDNARFVSEFGIQAAPALQTLRHWMAPYDLHLGSEGLLQRVKDNPDKANAMMLPVTGLPRTMKEYVDFSMWTQAEGLKFGIEHYRRRKPHCSGALIWQYNDCWPCISWSLIDYDGVGKASLYAVSRAFAPVLASFKLLGDDRFELWITNDTLESVIGRALVALTRLTGGDEWSEVAGFEIAPNASAPVWRGHALATADHALTVRSLSGQFPPNRQLLAPISRLELRDGSRPNVVGARIDEGRLSISIAADTYMAFVHLTSARTDLRFSDNYFDLAGGESATIIVHATAYIGPEDIDVRCWDRR